jgi:hypothetical protein
MQKFQRVFILEDEQLCQQVSLAFINDINMGNPVVLLNDEEDALQYLQATLDVSENLHPVDLIIYDTDIAPGKVGAFLDRIDELQHNTELKSKVILLYSEIAALPAYVHSLSTVTLCQKPVTEIHLQQFLELVSVS